MQPRHGYNDIGQLIELPALGVGVPSPSMWRRFNPLPLPARRRARAWDSRACWVRESRDNGGARYYRLNIRGPKSPGAHNATVGRSLSRRAINRHHVELLMAVIS
jgi:hypothetical protein